LNHVIMERGSPAASTADRIMDAAEELIARDGIDVSIRAINAHAGANAASAHYHFGSKQELVAAVLNRRMEALAEERRALLAEIAEPSLRPVLAALVRPLLRLATDEDVHYVRFLAVLRRSGEPWIGLARGVFRPIGHELDAMFAAVLADLPEPLREVRRTAATTLMTELLADVGTPESVLAGPAPADTLVDMLVGVVSAPVTSPR
jgi:AcrR family transcriptional regulator